MRPKHPLMLLMICLLAACAPAQVLYTAVPAGDVLPAEAQRVIDRATATAGAVATQAAQATATERSAVSTSTSAARATWDSLAVQQTQAAMGATATQAANLETATTAANTQAAQATAFWTTPTVAAMQTQAAAETIDFNRRQEASAASAEFWKLLRYTVLAVVGVLGAVACVLAVVWGAKTIRVEELRQKANIAREAFRVLAPGHWAEWLPDDGYRVYQLPGTAEPATTVIENVPTQPSRIHAWRQTVRLFAHWGDRYGFGIREIGPTGADVVSDPAWRTLSKLLKDAGVLAEAKRDGQKGRVTAWAAEWDYRRFAEELSSGRLALPFPEQVDPPKVAFTVPTQHHN